MGRQNVWLIVFVLVVFLAYIKRGQIVTEIKKISDSALKLIAKFEGFSAVGLAVQNGHCLLAHVLFELGAVRRYQQFSL